MRECGGGEKTRAFMIYANTSLLSERRDGLAAAVESGRREAEALRLRLKDAERER